MQSPRYCYTNEDGKDIFLYFLRNAKGTEVSVTNYGAIITAFKLRQDDGTTNDIVLGFDDIREYRSDAYMKQNPFFGAAVGRYGNRISKAAFSIDGKHYPLHANMGPDHLHGGNNGIDKKVWTFIQQDENPATLTLEYLSPDGEEGYPGNLKIRIRYELNDQDELSFTYSAETDQPTAVNLTHHSYFNLHNGSGTIHDHEVRVCGSKILEQNASLSTTGTLIPVEGTEFDFRTFTSVGERLSTVPEYDKSFEIDPSLGDQNGEDLQLAAELRFKANGLLLQVYTSDPVVHFYTGKWIPPLTGKNGQAYDAFSGLCLETQIHPNAINIPHFPDTVLRPGKIYHSKTLYKITH